MIPSIETLGLLKALPLSQEGDKFFVESENCTYIYHGGEWIQEVEKSSLNLYELNKQIISQMNPLSPEEYEKKLELINDFINSKDSKYYMLLNNEWHYYTIFHRNGENSKLDSLTEQFTKCFENIGPIYSIELVSDALEIWADTGQSIMVFYLFPYDLGVCECQ